MGAALLAGFGSQDSPAGARTLSFRLTDSGCQPARAKAPAGPVTFDVKNDGGAIRHFWGSELFYAPTDPGQDPRHVGTLEPVWNLFYLTPEGRPTDWDEQLSYS
jgi:predicted dithiol-disulfide oxidoreductase (DUF899 family)